ncbi:hypothetical protein CNMCM5878_010110 [Aspergillus fumigatiaffinis]|nr:hypothetical protein CNMCM5878_010110 [Aspergillus fumigatiaffinis]
MIIFIIGLILVHFAQADLSVVPVTPTASAILGQQTFHVKVSDGQPRFQPSRLSLDVGDIISFRVEDLSCSLRLTHYPCGSSETTVVEEEKRFVVRDESPLLFICDSADTDGCAPELLFTLNAAALPSQTLRPYETADLGLGSHITGPARIENGPMISDSVISSSSISSPSISSPSISSPSISSPSISSPSISSPSISGSLMSGSLMSSSLMSSAPRSTSPYVTQFQPLPKIAEAPGPLAIVPSGTSRTTSAYAPTPSSQEVELSSAAGALQVIGINLSCLLIIVFCVANMLY